MSETVIRRALWGSCPVCECERKVSPKTGLMKPHRRMKDGEMMLCHGTGSKPKEESK